MTTLLRARSMFLTAPLRIFGLVIALSLICFVPMRTAAYVVPLEATISAMSATPMAGEGNRIQARILRSPRSGRAAPAR